MALLLLLGCALISVARPAPAAAARALSLQVSLTQFDPAIPQPGDTLRLGGVVTNRSPVAVADLEGLLIYDPQRFNTRSGLDSYATGTGVFGFAAPGGAQPLALRELAPGQSEPFLIRQPVNELGLTPDEVGTYRIGVQIAGFTSAGAAVSTAVRTFLPWWPLGIPGTPPATPVAWLWPLIDRPPVAQDLVDPRLPAQLDSGGRLSALVTAGEAAQTLTQSPGRPAGTDRHGKPQAAVLPTTPVPVNWVIDPMLTSEARTMAAGYTVHGRPGPGRRAAAAWLGALSAAVPGGALMGLPYADPDLVAENRAGLSNEIVLAQRTGAAMLKADLGVPPLNGYAWPPGGALDQATANTLATQGYRVLIVSDVNLPAASQLFTHSALSRVPVSRGQLTALVSDSVLSQVVASGAGASASAQLLAAQRYLAESLFIDYEYPLLRALVIAPPRSWAPSAGYAGRLLSDTAHAPWLDPMTLPQLVADPKINVAARDPLGYPASARAAELPGRYLAPVARTQRRLDRLNSLFTRPDNAMVRGLQIELLRGLSSYWRGDLSAGAAVRRAVTSTVNGDLAGVKVFSAGTVTFTSHHGTVPLTIVNHLPLPVQVHLRLFAPAARIAQQPGALIIAAGQAVQHEVGLTLQAAGTFPLQVSLTTASGAVLGATVDLRIISTAYGALTLGITGGALVLLLVAAALRLARRARRTKRANGTSQADPGAGVKGLGDMREI